MAWTDELAAASRRGKEQRAEPRAKAAYYDRKSGRVVIRLNSRLDVGFSPRDAQGLERATPGQLDAIEISPSGLGIHFPKLDADLYLPSLLAGLFGSRRWMAQRLGQIGGRAKTAAKKSAARRNGRLGGRPKKLAAS